MEPCLRRELKDCPYRRKKVDYEHWIDKCGESIEFAVERADILCRAFPCNYALEITLEKLVDTLK